MHTDLHKGRITRRSFLNFVGCGTFLLTVGVSIPATVRFLFPRVLFESPSIFTIGTSHDFNLNESGLMVYENWKEEHGVWVVKENNRLYVIKAKCTHLGCTPNYFANEGLFKCPCHGSQFYANGINFAGPAPRPLERLKIYINNEGIIMIDKGKSYTYRDFDKKGAYLEVD